MGLFFYYEHFDFLTIVVIQLVTDYGVSNFALAHIEFTDPVLYMYIVLGH